MSVKMNIKSVAKLCKVGAERTLFRILSLGARPDDPNAALLWDQQLTRLQGQLNSLTAMVSKLTALGILEELEEFRDELKTISEISKKAQKDIKKIKSVSGLLEKTAKILDLGLAVLAVAAAPSTMTISAAITAATSVDTAE